MIKLTTTLLLISSVVGYSQTKQEVKEFINDLGIEKPLIVTAQCYYESGHLKSNVYKKNNNLFGMKFAHNRLTLAIGKDENNHAIYRNWKESVIDYMIWQNKYYKGGDYYEFIKQSGYCPYNENYIETLKNIKVWTVSIKNRFNVFYTVL